MAAQASFRILHNIPLTETVWRMTLQGDTRGIRAGQFVNIAIDGLFLRRPISVCDCHEDRLVLIYKVVGEGTARMSRMTPGVDLDLLTGLGNGYTVGTEVQHPLLVGGGVGVPPLYLLAKELREKGLPVEVVLGFNTAAECFLIDEFEALGCRVTVATADGSRGVKGFVTTAIAEERIEFDYFYACGPLPMLRALCEGVVCEGQLSFEERMGCGFGGCMGCTCQTRNGYKRVCKEGPVFLKSEVIF